MNQKPIPDVSVVIKGSNKGVSTNTDGSFTIAAKPGDVICYGSGEETSAAGIYVGDGKMVQASETRGKVATVKVDTTQESFALELFEDTKVIAQARKDAEFILNHAQNPDNAAILNAVQQKNSRNASYID